MGNYRSSADIHGQERKGALHPYILSCVLHQAVRVVGIPDALRNVEEPPAFLRLMNGNDVQVVSEEILRPPPVGVLVGKTLQGQGAQHGHARLRVPAELRVDIGKQAVAALYGGFHVRGDFLPKNPWLLTSELPGGMIAEKTVERGHLHPAAKQFRRGMPHESPSIRSRKGDAGSRKPLALEIGQLQMFPAGPVVPCPCGGKALQSGKTRSGQQEGAPVRSVTLHAQPRGFRHALPVNIMGLFMGTGHAVIFMPRIHRESAVRKNDRFVHVIPEAAHANFPNIPAEQIRPPAAYGGSRKIREIAKSRPYFLRQ